METTTISIINTNRGESFLAIGNDKSTSDLIMKFDKAIDIGKFSSQKRDNVSIGIEENFTIEELIEKIIELKDSPSLIVPVHAIGSIYRYETLDSKKRLEKELNLGIITNILCLGVIGVSI